MARPCKKRRICQLPRCTAFRPQGTSERPTVRLTLEEFECLRLMDYEGLTQAACAAQLGVARTTAQALYQSARVRLAAALVEGRPLVIEGGSYELCPCTNAASCAPAFCPKRQKGVFPMKIGIPYDESTQQIFQHFGKTAAFKIYTVADGAVQSSEVVTTGGQLHEGAAQLLAAHGVDTVICGGVGGGMQMALTQAGIRFYSGVQGAADAAAEALLAGNLAYDPAARGCQHHHEHGCGHAHA